jgi:HlyD family secretion protein
MPLSPDGGRGLARAAILAAATLLLAGCSGGDEAPAPRTAPVERGNVETRVSSTGTLVAVRSQGLAFPKGAQLKEVLVKVGDHVKAGQVLARLDGFAFQQQLNQQQAELDRQQAQLALLVNGTAVPGSQATLDQARKILTATQRNADAINKAADVATDGAERQLDADRRVSDQADRAYRQCLDNPTATAASTTSTTGSTGSTTGTGSTGTGTTGSTGSTGSTGTTSGTGTDDDGDSRGSGRHRFGGRGPGSALGTYPALGTDPALGASTAPGTHPAAGGYPAADPAACSGQASARESARRQVVTSQVAVNTARQQEDVNSTQGRLSVESARQSVVTAQNSLDSASTDRPSAIAAQTAVVTSAQATVALARKDVDNTVLTAPVDGTVAAINGNAGEFVGPSTSTTTTAPGSAAALPGTSASATVNEDGTASKVNNGPFLVLDDITAFQVVVPFSESDAVKVQADRPATVTFDALPDLQVSGRVLAVAPAGTSINGVVNYYATVLIDGTDPRLRDGTSAEAAVVAGSADDVLSVPNTAVTRQGADTTVTVAGPDGQTRAVPFQAGLVGDDRTQVLGGLTEGQLVQLPSVPAAPRPGPGGGR